MVGIKLNLIFIFLIGFVLSSCLPEQNVRRPLEENNNITKDNTPEEESVSVLPVTWLNSGILSETVTVNIDNAKSVFIFGDQVHDYLLKAGNFTATYCMEVRYPQTANTKPKRLRLKVTPGISNQFTQGVTTRYLTVNLGTDLGNDLCNIQSQELVNGQKVLISPKDSNFDSSVDANDLDLVFKTQDVCTNCINIFESSEVVLYGHVPGTSPYLVRIDTDNIDYTGLKLRIDMNSNSSAGQSSCSDSECISKGFDCCVQGQCINEKEIKTSGVNADPVGFAIAEQLKFNDNNWYKNYPQFYYACLEQPPAVEVTPNPPDPIDPVGESDDRILELIADYNCVEELKANTISTPFHRNPINGSATYAVCDITNSAADNYYENVMARLYQNCGCVEKVDLNTMVSTCPAYTYAPVYLTDGNGVATSTVVAMNCVSPPVEQTPLPFQNMDVNVNSRSAPHRFFDTNNIEIDPTKALPSGATGNQEGTSFQYLDDFYIFPHNGSFNMNSILGPMTVQLNQARPALQIDIEFDKQYMIATRSGFYQACPTCAKDSWFNNFSAFPFGNSGVGVQPVGFTTRRDTYNSNASLGNYEDTVFGRACFVPPTMIAYSHLENTADQTQRLNRLTTQAALFANGYQRDWYGFNKGALIGSFDGVTWFAVGKGRIAKSTSNKLFLAINAPFADLASPTDHIVSVQEYDFKSTAAIYDYDPTQEINAATQNEAGSCQEWHKCDKDSHCISKLGWEYTCADVSFQKTNWPQFEALGASEISNKKRTGVLTQFLQQGTLPPASGTKRCVYRGAGAPCRVDYANITDEGLRKNLTCAPNFYCANINSGNAFNSEVARFARPLNELVESKNHIYGQDANILGRPKHYLNTGNLTRLPAEAVLALEDNLKLTDPSGSGSFGLCRPGKKLPDYQSLVTTKNWEQTEQHKAADLEYRTDYISQIAGCNSALYTDLRYSSCPMLDEDGNYIHTQDDFLNDNFVVPNISLPQAKRFVTERYTFAQNACGLESLDPTATPTASSSSESLKPYSAFKLVEGSSLGTSNIVYEKSLAMDSCQRKAGSICHTDLDCSPNKVQADVVDLSPLSRFGNQAEKSYYEEYLICGQSRPEPSVDDEDFNTYNIHNNRCCRPIGEKITMYSEDSPRALESIGLDTNVFGSLNPTSPTRYSRYSVVESTINELTKKSNIIRPTANSEDNDNNKTLDNSINITNFNQWKTIHNAATKTCCGGNWVRKFEDNTNDWSRQRLSINPTNFKCLNYRSKLFLSENAPAYNITQSKLDQGKSSMCLDSAQAAGGCAQQDIAALNGTSVSKPILNTTITRMELTSDPNDMLNKWANNIWSYNTFPNSPLSDGSHILNWSDANNPGGFADAQSNQIPMAILTEIPAFVTFDNFNTDVNVFLTSPLDGSDVACIESPTVVPPATGGLDDIESLWTAGSCPDIAGYNCCYAFDPLTRLIRVAYNETDVQLDSSYDDENVFMKIDFEAVGTLAWEIKKAGATSLTDPAVIDHRRSARAGNALYYLQKLAKLEYVGIPQMTFEPIYCNDNYQELVPGIFKADAFGQALKTVMDFINHDRTFVDPSVTDPFTTEFGVPAAHETSSINLNLVGTQELLEIQPIFSDNQFQCCLELGTVMGDTESPTRCCSGYAIEDDTNDGKLKCALPSGTDLHVYFNKFVSSEGINKDLDSPLGETDFDPRTGEPKNQTDVESKLTQLGEDFCETGIVRKGGAFGNFNPQIQPQDKRTGALHGIVDDIKDNNNADNPSTGYNAFQSGFRWNHHLYCDSEDT